MNQIISSPAGLIHLLSSVIALYFGAQVLFLKKGTKRHIKSGYVYFVSMIVLLATSFMVYNLFGRWGIFHYLSVFSSVTLAMGMIPILKKSLLKNWQYFHFSFMYWSVVGLYAAFAAELLVRIPNTAFFGMVGIASGGVFTLGQIFFFKNKAKWIAVFNK